MHTTMNALAVRPLPRLRALPVTLPLEGAVRLELVEGIPVLRAAGSIQGRVEELLFKGKVAGLTAEESEELDRYEEIDDYLSLVNRVTRNLLQSSPGEG